MELKKGKLFSQKRIAPDQPGERLSSSSNGCLELRDIPNLQEIKGLRELKSLKRLKLVGCSSLVKFELSGLQKLEVLDIQKGCRELEKLPSLANLVSLQELRLNDLSSLREIGNDDIEGLKCLKKLDLDRCKALERLPTDQLLDLKELSFVSIVGCTNLNVDQLVALTNPCKGFHVWGPGTNELYFQSQQYSDGGLLSTTYDKIGTVVDGLLGNWW